ncbi:MAG: undecaprenyl-diphosphate phosphatase [Clostridia bacterium]|nr:undecaprenyl-diphosphate phosphatase [Clostridia bacterium]
MTVLQALLLGIVQGLTEFLPVSSSGHLVLLQNLFNIDLSGMDMFFDIILHIGTLFAVCAVYWKDILNLFKRPWTKLWYLVFASIPAALVGLLLDDVIDEFFYGGRFLYICFAATALLLTITHIYAKKKKNSLPLGKKHVALMGLAQAVAVIPGISRSGSTIAAGTLGGADSDEVATFSFLMSIPVILGSFLISLVKGIAGGELAATFANASGNLGVCVAVSVVAAALSGFAAIKLMLKAVSKRNYIPFIVYLLILSVLCAYLTVSGRL